MWILLLRLPPMEGFQIVMVVGFESSRVARSVPEVLKRMVCKDVGMVAVFEVVDVIGVELDEDDG